MLVSNVFLPREKVFLVKFMLGVPYVSSLWKTIPSEIYAWCPICFFPVKNYSSWNLCFVSHMFLPVKSYFPWYLFLVSHMFLPCEKLFSVKFMLGVPCVSSPWKIIPCEIYAWCPICFFPVKNYSSWNLCLVSNMFVPVKKYSPVKFMLVSHMFLHVKNYFRWNLCLVSHMFLPVKNYPREMYAWCPICFSAV